MENLKSKSLAEQAKQAILDYIKTLDLDNNNKLPSEENMSKLLGVSRITIRSALNELSSDGIIFRRQGKGTFVNIEALKMKSQLNPIKSFTQIIKENGYNPTIKTLGHKIIDPSPNIRKTLNLDVDDKIVVVYKVFLADESPCMYCVDSFPIKLLKDKSDLDDLIKYKASIFEFLKNKSNINITWDKVEIKTVTNIDLPELNNAFECNSPKSFLLFEGPNFDENDNPIMHVEEYVDTNFISFNLIRQKF